MNTNVVHYINGMYPFGGDYMHVIHVGTQHAQQQTYTCMYVSTEIIVQNTLLLNLVNLFLGCSITLSCWRESSLKEGEIHDIRMCKVSTSVLMCWHACLWTPPTSKYSRKALSKLCPYEGPTKLVLFIRCSTYLSQFLTTYTLLQ